MSSYRSDETLGFPTGGSRRWGPDDIGQDGLMFEQLARAVHQCSPRVDGRPSKAYHEELRAEARKALASAVESFPAERIRRILETSSEAGREPALEMLAEVAASHPAEAIRRMFR